MSSDVSPALSPSIPPGEQARRELPEGWRWVPWVACLAVHLAIALGQWSAHRTEFLRYPFLLNAGVLLASLWCLKYVPAAAVASVAEGSRPRNHLGGRILWADLFLIVAFGAAIRTIGFEVFPRANGSFVEEAQTGSVAFRSLCDFRLDPDFPWTDLLAEIGILSGGRSMLALRVPFVVYSILSLPLFVLVARFLFRSRVATLGVAVLFAANACLAGIGRVAMETCAPITTTLFALAACCQAQRVFSPFHWGLAGVAIGMLWQEYFSYRMVAASLLGFLIWVLAQGPRGTDAGASAEDRPTQGNVRLGLILIAMLMATVAPTAIANSLRPGGQIEGLARHWQDLRSNAPQASMGAIARGQFAKIGPSYSTLFRAVRADNLPEDQGLLGDVLGGIAIAACLYCVATARRRPERWLVGLLPLGLPLVGGLVTLSPERYRYYVCVPFLLLGFGFLLDDWRTRWRGKIAGMILGLSILGLAGAEIHRFWRALASPEVQREMDDLRLEAALEIRALQDLHPHSKIYLVRPEVRLQWAKNDYEFLYDRSRTCVLGSIKDDCAPGPVLSMLDGNEVCLRSPRFVLDRRILCADGKTELLIGRIHSP